jgi:hypothetical protein
MNGSRTNRPAANVRIERTMPAWSQLPFWSCESSDFTFELNQRLATFPLSLLLRKTIYLLPSRVLLLIG